MIVTQGYGVSAALITEGYGAGGSEVVSVTVTVALATGQVITFPVCIRNC